MTRLPLRLLLGLALAALLFAPFGVYHSRSEPYVVGYLWGYDLPIGYAGLASGALIILFPRIGFMRSLKLGTAMIIAGIAVALALLAPKYFFVNLLNGTSFSPTQVDVDYPLGNMMALGASLLTVMLGLTSRAKQARPQKASQR